MDRIQENITKCHADMKVVEYLLDIIKDWNSVINYRHVKFVETYFQYKGQMKVVATALNYTESDMLCIFWRIQRQLFVEYINRTSAGLIKPGKVPDKFNDLLLWNLQQYRDDAESIFLKIKGKEERRKQVKHEAKIIAFPKGIR